jgi:geranylgeranyl diphosphate synthase type II
MLSINPELARLRAAIDRALPDLLPSGATIPRSLTRVMGHAVLSGGKRLRPILTLAAAEFLGANPGSLMRSACGIELVHKSSLVLDDLPCMDDNDLRRGKPSTHQLFGESSAILGSASLLCHGIDLVCENAQQLEIPTERALLAVRGLTAAVGAAGMCGGQELDLDARPRGPALRGRIRQQKTAVLFSAAAATPALLLGTPATTVEALTSFGSALGDAFHLGDDILDNEIEPKAGRQLLFERVDAAKQKLGDLQGRSNLLLCVADAIQNREA